MTGQTVPNHKLMDHAGASVYYEVNKGHPVSYSDFYRYLQLNLVSLDLRDNNLTIDTDQQIEPIPRITTRKSTQFTERSIVIYIQARLSTLTNFSVLTGGSSRNSSAVFSDLNLPSLKSSSSQDLPSVLVSPSNANKLKETILIEAFKNIQQQQRTVSERGNE